MVTLCAHVHDQHDTAKSIESIVEQLHFDNYDQVHNYISHGRVGTIPTF